MTGNAVAATNLVQRAGTAGCLSETGTYDEATATYQCQVAHGLVGATSIVLSADGENAYVASSGWNSLAVLTRNTVDGALGQAPGSGSCFDSLSALYPDCTKVRELGGADDVAISPDGKNVYVAAPSDDAVVVFDRDPLTGALTLSPNADGCVNEDGSGTCTNGRALDGATSVTVSPDGKNVYVASSGPNGGLAIFDRDTDSGDLTQKDGAAGCINETAADSCANGLDQMLDIRDVEISPDGKTVYAVSVTRDAVTIYPRDVNTGELTPMPAPAGCIKDSGGGGCQTGTALIEAKSLTVSPDGKTAYVAGERSDAIAVFDRDIGTGALTQKAGTAGCVSNTGLSDQMQAGTAGACQDGLAMDGIDSIAIPPDGKALYATTSNSSGLVIFERHPDGTLTQRPGSAGCITETGYEDPSLSWTAGACGDGRALINADRLITSADSKTVYTAAPGGGVGIFDVVEPPPEPTPTTPPPPPDSSDHPGTTADCKDARAKLRAAEKRLQANQRTLRRLSLLALRAHREGSSQQSMIAEKIRKARSSVKRWRKATHLAKVRQQRLCA